MLRAMGTVAFQTIYGYREKAKRDSGLSKTDGPPTDSKPGKRPGFIDTCHALASGGEVVRTHWPEFYEARAAKSGS